MSIKHLLSSAALAAAPAFALAQTFGSGVVRFEFTSHTGPVAGAAAPADFNTPSQWFNVGLVNGVAATSGSGWARTGSPYSTNGYVLGSVPLQAGLNRVSLRYSDVRAGSSRENIISFTPRNFSDVRQGRDFVLGTLTFQNGSWNGAGYSQIFDVPTDLGFRIVTQSASGAVFNQTITGTIRLAVHAVDNEALLSTLGGQQAEADWVYIDSPAASTQLGALRVYEPCCNPGVGSVGSVDVIARFNSLDLVGLGNAQGGGFITASVAPLPAVPEPGTWALLAAGLVALAARVSASRRSAAAALG